MAKVPERKYFMNQGWQSAMGNKPRTHKTCKDITGVQRPGKTARDRALREVR